ncbi:MAG: glutamine--fructose-6-phosphate transaminase (isomerizing), partial [Verrucomicrobiota bacterium]
EAAPIMLDGLRRLEYRGYDSAGMALVNDGELDLRKCSGRIDNLRGLLDREGAAGTSGVSHTRWATHGEPTDENAHPHLDQSGKIALVHNGVIENYQSLREQLEEKGHQFHSQTDSEVLAHLLGQKFADQKKGGVKQRLVQALRSSLALVKGTYGVAVVHADVPDYVIGARLGSPLIVGLGKGENFIASDASALVAHTQDAIYLSDYDLVEISSNEFSISSLQEGKESTFEVQQVEFQSEDTEKGDFPHFMLKEIFEQPQSIANAFRGRLYRENSTAMLGGLNMSPRDLRGTDRIVLCGCGTALHAGMVGEYMIEGLAHIPTETEIASEFRYRNLPTDKHTLFFVISQSGETIDTLSAMREAQRKGHRVLGLVNSVGSTIARESDGGSYLHAGPEIGVAATKSFTSQVTVLTLLALWLGRMRNMGPAEGSLLIDELEGIPEKVTRILKLSDQIKEIAEKYIEAEGMLFLGRQGNYPAALEGALKMKEISYIYASGHPSAELKHGVIALIKETLPSVFLCPKDHVYEKNISSMEEVKARKGPIIAVASEGDEEIHKVADDVIYVPQVHEQLSPLLNVIPLQLLSYHFAVARGCDVDKPRNLAKSVTVE